jgi:GNAT superfamily N-acetyltransferase
MINIRSARADDVQIIHEMLLDSAKDQGSPGSLVATPDNLLEDGFGANPRFSCVIAEVDGEPAGLALYFFNYSTWVSRVGLYLEDLYVSPAYRRRGVARALMTHLARIAVEQGCERFLWMVHAANERAIAFYEGFGATAVRDWVVMVLWEDAIREAARGGRARKRKGTPKAGVPDDS